MNNKKNSYILELIERMNQSQKDINMYSNSSDVSAYLNALSRQRELIGILESEVSKIDVKDLSTKVLVDFGESFISQFPEDKIPNNVLIYRMEARLLKAMEEGPLFNESDEKYIEMKLKIIEKFYELAEQAQRLN